MAAEERARVAREAQVAAQSEEAAEVEALLRALRARRKEVADKHGMVGGGGKGG